MNSKLGTLNHMQDGAANNVKKLQQLQALQQKELDRVYIEAEQHKYSKSHVDESVEKVREKYAEPILAIRRELLARAKIAEEMRAEWGDRTYLLSKAAFVEHDEQKDAIVRQAEVQRLERLPLPILEREVKNAIATGKLALAWEASQAAQRIHKAAIDLASVEVPGQAEALAAINFVALNAPARAELIAADCEGRRLDPVAKLNLAHAIAA